MPRQPRELADAPATESTARTRAPGGEDPSGKRAGSSQEPWAGRLAPSPSYRRTMTCLSQGGRARLCLRSWAALRAVASVSSFTRRPFFKTQRDRFVQLANKPPKVRSGAVAIKPRLPGSGHSGAPPPFSCRYSCACVFIRWHFGPCSAPTQSGQFSGL